MSSNHDSVGDHFLRARELEGDERARYLQALGDEVRAEVASLLDYDTEEEPPEETAVRKVAEAALRDASRDRPIEDPADEDGDLPRLTMPPPLLGRLIAAFGEGVDPDVLLDGDDVSRDLARETLSDSRDERYATKDRVARGGMGTVMRVWDRDLKRHLAMKISRSARVEKRPDATARARRFIEEAQITGQLDHPGVVPVHDVGLDEKGNLFFTMRLVKGLTLREVFRRAGDPQDEWNQARALNTLSKVCETMAFAHSRQVIHRDLKPANVMVGAFGETYVMDWGLAKIQGREDSTLIKRDLHNSTIFSAIRTIRSTDPESTTVTQDGDVLGTPAYMAPEQARGDLEQVGPPADVYAIGAMLYLLLTGHPPYMEDGATDPMSVHARVVKGPPLGVEKRCPGTPPELVAICEKAMAREIEDRYPNMIEMAEDLRAYLENRVVRAHNTGAVTELRKWIQRNRTVAASILIATLFAVFGLLGTNLVTVRAKQQIETINLELREQASMIETQRNELLHRNETLERQKRDLRDARNLAQADLLIAKEVELWPRRPDRLDAMEDWLGRARELVSQLSTSEQSLAELEASPAGDDNRDLQWKRDVLRNLVKRLHHLGDDRSGLIEDMQERAEVARHVASVTLEEYEDDWAFAIDEIASSPHYGGLEFEPQIGLIPLEPDPVSELWEFWLWESGERPERDEETGRYRIDGETGLVLILVPGGPFVMGATTDPRGPNYDPATLPGESFLNEVTLDPYFISKYEITQGQWSRVHRGENPAHHHQGQNFVAEDGASHPVEQVPWTAAAIALSRYDLLIPTEAQWEFACRALTDTPHSCPRDEMGKYANLADPAYREFFASENFEPVNDGWVVHAPVGLFLPNRFGLHDVHGNVSEWVRDRYTQNYNEVAARQGDGLRDTQGSEFRGFRGGSFHDIAVFARSAYRVHPGLGHRSSGIGVRPSRALNRDG